MAKYFYDTEFIEGTQKEWFGKSKPTIELISIGIVCEDGREFYEVSKDFNLMEAWNRYDTVTEKVYGDMRNRYPEGITKRVYWIRENVLKPIFNDWVTGLHKKIDRLGLNCAITHEDFNFKNFRRLLNIYGKSNDEIKKGIIDFVNPDLGWHVTAYNNSELKRGGSLHDHFEFHNVTSDGEVYYAQPEFYSYYSAYDHVVLCWLFGKMIDLPKGFPMYTIDLKQTLDEYANQLADMICYSSGNHTVWTTDEAIKYLNTQYGFPESPKEHHALVDARFNYELYNFLQ